MLYSCELNLNKSSFLDRENILSQIADDEIEIYL
jgi:hypothetical protein